jgi:hypothetical protein
LDLPASQGSGTPVLARAFADGRPIPSTVLSDGPLDPERLLSDFKQWFGREVALLAKRVGRPDADLTRVSDRTLRNWRRNNPAEVPE